MDNGQLVPELRFSEFDGGWKKVTVSELVKSEILKKPQDGNHGEIHPKSSDYVDLGIPFIMANSLSEGEINYQNCKHIPKEVADRLQKGFSLEGDVLLTHKGTVGEVAIVGENNFPYLMLTPQVTYYRILETNKLDREFLAKIFISPIFKKKLRIESDSGTRPYIGITQQSKLSLCLPEIKEQQKIANFLTAIDQRITLLKQKKAALEQYKKGLMQKIFNQEIRFTDDEGDDFVDWEEKRFDELYEFKRTNSLSREKLNYDNGEVFNIHYGDIHTKFKTHFELDNEYVPFVNSDINLSKVKEDEFIQTGDLVIADASEDYEDIGKAIEINNIANSKVIAGLHTFLVRRINDHLEVGFGGFIMQSAEVRLQIKKIAQGTKVLGISTGRLRKIKLKVPSKKEQQKIADCLSAIDQSIYQLTNQIDQTTQFKKGLLQRMFV